MKEAQIEARKLLLKRLKKWYEECAKNGIDIKDANGAFLTLAMSLFFSGLDEVYTLGESNKIAVQQVENFARNTYDARLKKKLEYLSEPDK